MPRLVPALALTLLAACSSLNPMTLARLATLDFMTVDPADIVARIDIPAGFEIPEGGAVIEVVSARADTGQSLRESFPLTRRGDLWHLAPTEAAALRETQGLVRLWEAEAPEANTGSFSMALTGCARSAEVDRAETVDADVSVDGGASFLPFLRDLSVGTILDQAAVNGAELVCS